MNDVVNAYQHLPYINFLPDYIVHGYNTRSNSCIHILL